jgi:hypothetical protein
MSSFDKDQLNGMPTDELALVAAECLSRLKIGRQPLPLFAQLSRLMVLSTFEVTPLRSSRKNTEVLLAQRPESDPWWPSQWHLPGSVQLPTGEPGIRSYDNAADDILTNEFDGTINRVSPVSIFNAQLRSGPRGSEQTVFGWTNVELGNHDVEPQEGRFFRVDALLSEHPKEGLVIGHDLIIQNALAHRALSQG